MNVSEQKSIELINAKILRVQIPQEPGKCERCNYDPVDPDAEVADFFQDCYTALCTQCAEHLHRLMGRMT